MHWLLIIFILAIVAAPIMWVMPSRREQGQERMREQARKQGLQVKVCNLPQSHRSQVRREDPLLGTAYRLRLYREHPQLGELWLMLKVDQEVGWEQSESQGCSDAVKQALEEILPALPNDVRALGCEGDALVAYWRERGGEEAVIAIKEQLTRLSERLSSPR